jgi:hypothetical protein
MAAGTRVETSSHPPSDHRLKQSDFSDLVSVSTADVALRIVVHSSGNSLMRSRGDGLWVPWPCAQSYNSCRSGQAFPSSPSFDHIIVAAD